MAKMQPYTTTLWSRELKWSGSEKLIARKAFNLALKREFSELLQQTRRRLAKAKEPADLWELEDFLARRHRDIAIQFDFRYSVLPYVFFDLIKRGILSKEDLRGLSEDKLDF
ncbi:MAG TPA: hypothetical protein VMP68_16260 [Candidatus Eisenbacteria bacterium]|nr:hypothetical protein [Candidatus Eisenbacteria bacterium]